jgi:hypothetical protein
MVVHKRSLFCSIHLTPFQLQVSFALSTFAVLGDMCLPCRQPPETAFLGGMMAMMPRERHLLRALSILGEDEDDRLVHWI